MIVEILKKSDDAIKSSGAMLEIPFARSSLFVKEILPTSTNGVEHYPRRNDFKGLQKLPSVELVSNLHPYCNHILALKSFKVSDMA